MSVYKLSWDKKKSQLNLSSISKNFNYFFKKYMWIRLAKDIKFIDKKDLKNYYIEIFNRAYLIYLITGDKKALSLSLRNLWIFSKDIDFALFLIKKLINKDKYNDILYLHLALIYFYKKHENDLALKYINRAIYFCHNTKDKEYYQSLKDLINSN